MYELGSGYPQRGRCSSKIMQYTCRRAQAEIGIYALMKEY